MKAAQRQGETLFIFINIFFILSFFFLFFFFFFFFFLIPQQSKGEETFRGRVFCFIWCLVVSGNPQRENLPIVALFFV